jgi:hypothetical protein
MFSLELTGEQIKARRGFIVVWQHRDKISRVTFELTEPSHTRTETVAKVISLERFGAKLFGGFGDRGARIEFTNLGTVNRIIPIDR